MTPQKMRAAVLYDVNDVRVEERPVPELRDGELLVRTMASGICSGDVMGWYIARKARIGNDDMIDRTLLGACAGEADDDGHGVLLVSGCELD